MGQILTLPKNDKIQNFFLTKDTCYVISSQAEQQWTYCIWYASHLVGKSSRSLKGSCNNSEVACSLFLLTSGCTSHCPTYIWESLIIVVKCDVILYMCTSVEAEWLKMLQHFSASLGSKRHSDSVVCACPNVLIVHNVASFRELYYEWSHLRSSQWWYFCMILKTAVCSYSCAIPLHQVRLLLPFLSKKRLCCGKLWLTCNTFE